MGANSRLGAYSNKYGNCFSILSRPRLYPYLSKLKHLKPYQIRRLTNIPRIYYLSNFQEERNKGHRRKLQFEVNDGLFKLVGSEDKCSIFLVAEAWELSGRLSRLCHPLPRKCPAHNPAPATLHGYWDDHTKYLKWWISSTALAKLASAQWARFSRCWSLVKTLKI